MPAEGKLPVVPSWGKTRLSLDDLSAHLSDGQLNIGIVLNQSPFIDVECDSPEAETALLKLFGGRVPRTPTWQSKRGKHRLFRRPDGLQDAAVVKLDGIEFRGVGRTKGAYSLVPPSITDGFKRHWLPGLRVSDVEPAELTPAVVELLRSPATRAKVPTTVGDRTVPEGQRNDWLFRRGCSVAAAGLSAHAIEAALKSENKASCVPPLPEFEVACIARSVSLRTGPDAQPLNLPSGRTDAANARRFVARFGDVIRWVGPWNKFLIWDERRWRLDQMLRIEFLAKEVAADFWRAIGNFSAEGTAKNVIAAMVGFARTSNNANGVRNMVALARSESPVAIGTEGLDTNPWLFNVQNGTLELKTGKLREHRREDFITKLTPVTFDLSASCPLWDKFLRTIFGGNDELIGYLQRLVGYTLTGVTKEHVLPFCHGTGANGKSTFIETLLKLIGSDYGMKAAPDLLMAKRGESHPTDRADLFGKRFVACVETEEGRRMAEALVKELTGGDRVRARRMREDFWEFVPTHHVWLAGNHKPAVRGTDYGIWRRIKLIPFDVVIPEDQQDKELPAKLAAELPGILNWAVTGCLDWQRDGMREPDIVRAATNDYSVEMDEVGQFIEEQCELGPGFLAPATELYQAFLAAIPGSSMTQQSFGASLSRRGFQKQRITKGSNKAKHGWARLQLRADASAGHGCGNATDPQSTTAGERLDVPRGARRQGR